MNQTIPEESVIVDGEVYAQHVAINPNYYHPTGDFIPFSAEDKQQTLLHRWSRILRRFAMNTALEEGDRRVSYAAFNTLANRVAHAILARRVPKELPVAALFEIESDLQIGLFAIWKAGNFFVWLEPEQPLAHNQLIVEDSGAPVVVTNQKHADLARQLWPGEGQVIVIDELPDNLPLFDPPITIDAASPAYLVYSSDNTDRPTGIVELHRNLVAMMAMYERIFHFSTHDRVALIAHGSDWACSAAAALMYGGTSLAFDWRKEGLERFLPWIRDSRVTVLLGGAPVRLFLSSLDGSEEFPSLRVILGGGEPMVRAHLLAYQQYLPDSCVLGNSYCASECRSITLMVLDKNNRFEGRVLPVGFPTLHADVEIWNERDRSVRAGETGEIVAITPYAAQGYWKLPGLTARRFGMDWQDRRYFRTDDWGRLDEQGCLWILGRKDGQLTIRGNRVDSVEIEAAILELPGIKESAVVALGETDETRELFAFVASPVAIAVSELCQQLAAKLPDYMVPASIYVVDDLPRNSNGKIDRSLLRAMAVNQAQLSTQTTAAMGTVSDPLVSERIEEESVEVLNVEEAVASPEIADDVDIIDEREIGESVLASTSLEAVDDLDLPSTLESAQTFDLLEISEVEENSAGINVAAATNYQETLESLERDDLLATEASDVSAEIAELTEFPETTNLFEVEETLDSPDDAEFIEIPESVASVEIDERVDATAALEFSEIPEAIEVPDKVGNLEAVERAEPTDIPEAVEPIEAFESIEAVELIEAVEPIEAVELIETVELIEAEEPIEIVETLGATEVSEVVETQEVVESLETTETPLLSEKAELTEFPAAVEFLETPESFETTEMPDVQAALEPEAIPEPEAEAPLETVDIREFHEGIDAPEHVDLTQLPATFEPPDVAVPVEMAESLDLTETSQVSESLEVTASAELREFVDESEMSGAVDSAVLARVDEAGDTPDALGLTESRETDEVAEAVATLDTQDLVALVGVPDFEEGLEPAETSVQTDIVEFDTDPIAPASFELTDTPEATEATAVAELSGAPVNIEVAESVEAEENLEADQAIDLAASPEAEATVEAVSFGVIEEAAAPWTLETGDLPEEIQEVESPAPTPSLEVDEVDDVPVSAGVAAIADLADIPEVTEFPVMPEELDLLASLASTGSAEKSKLSEGEESPLAVEMLDVAEMQEETKSPESIAMAEAIESPVTPLNLGVHDAPEVTESLEFSENSELVEAPATAEVVEAPVMSELIEPPVADEAPEPVKTRAVEETTEAIAMPPMDDAPEMAEAPQVVESLELSEIPATLEVSEVVTRDETLTGVEVKEVVDESIVGEATLEAQERAEPLAPVRAEEPLPVAATTQPTESPIVDRAFLEAMHRKMFSPQPSVTVQPLSSTEDDHQPPRIEVAPVKVPAPNVELLLPKESVVVNGETIVQHVKIGQQNHHPTGEHVPIVSAELEKTLLHRFGRMVERFDSNPAIEDGNRVLSYVEFNALANRIAHALIGRKLSSKQPVAVLCGIESDLYIATFAVWKAGLFFVWLEPQQALARNKSIVEDSGATVVITNRKHAELARQLFSDPTGIVVAEEMTSGYPSYDPDITLQPNSPAYLMYPTVSTGKPKGVLEGHRNLAEMLVVRQSFLHFSNQERVAHLSAASDWAFAMCAALMYGGCVLPYRDSEEGLAHLSHWFIERRITIASGGAMLRSWLLSLDGSQKFPNLRLVGLDGGASYQQHMQSYQRNLAERCLLLVAYRATECQTVSLLVIDKSCKITSRLLPSGFAAAHVAIEIWNDLKRPLPVGETGEIVVFTPFAAQSYWNSPELTKNQFGVDVKGRRYVRTGDLGRVDENGALWVLGRKEGQVKIRGTRVEIAEVEVALMDVPAIKEVAVIHSGATDETTLLTAFVTSSGATTGDAVRKELETRLPSTMVPATVRVVEEFPRTSTGEIDRALLQDVAAGVAKIPARKAVPAVAPAMRVESVRAEPVRSMNQAAEVQEKVPRSLPSHFKSTLGIDAVQVMPGTPGNRPIFFCPGRNGSLKVVRRDPKWMRGLGEQRALYGLVAANRDDAKGLYKNIRELVAASLFALRQIQPHGPYTLIGEGLGGKLAYEMARLLEQEGERVSLLALLDVPFGGGDTQDNSGNWLQRLFKGWRGKSGGQGALLAAYALQAKDERVFLAQRRYLDILKKFVPRKRHASPTLALFTRQYAHHRARWEKLLPAIKVTVVEGAHNDYLRVSGGRVGGLLRQAMEGAPAPQKKAVSLGSRQRTPIPRDRSKLLK